MASIRFYETAGPYYGQFAWSSIPDWRSAFERASVHCRIVAYTFWLTLAADRLEHESRGAPIALPAITVRPQAARQLCGPLVNNARTDTPWILRLDRIGLVQPAARRVSGQARMPLNLAQRNLLTEIYPPDLGQYAHREHLRKFDKNYGPTSGNFCVNINIKSKYRR